MNIFFREILLSSIMGSIFIGVILVVKLLFKKTISIKWSYNIWFILIGRLLAPFYPKGGIGTYIFIPKVMNEGFPINSVVDSFGTSRLLELMQNVTIDYSSVSLDSKEMFHFDINIIATLWLIGAIIYFLYMCFVYFKIRLLVNQSIEISDLSTTRLLQKCKNTMGITKPISIVSVEAIKQPCLCGLIKPRILLSEEFVDKLLDNEKEYIFIHELSHYKRKDHLINWIVIAVKSLYWFNPFIWYALYKMKQESELACDSLSLSYISVKEHKNYANTIIQLLRLVTKSQYISNTVSIINGRKGIERRIDMILNYKKCTRIKVLMSVTVVGVMAFLAATDIFATNNIEEKVKGLTSKIKVINTSDNVIDSSNDIISNSVTESSNNIISTGDNVTESKTIKNTRMDIKATEKKDVNFIWPVPGYNRISSLYGQRCNPFPDIEDINNKEDNKDVIKEETIGDVIISTPIYSEINTNTNQRYGKEYFHTGIDIPAPNETKIVTAASGTVLFSGWADGYGNALLISHDADTCTLYGHCSKLLVSEGEIISEGQEIAQVGTTGKSTGPHLHFAVIINNETKDPLNYLSKAH